MEPFITSAIPLLLVKNKYQLSNVPTNSNKTPAKKKKVKNFLHKIDRLIDIQTDTQTLSIHIPNIY